MLHSKKKLEATVVPGHGSFICIGKSDFQKDLPKWPETNWCAIRSHSGDSSVSPIWLYSSKAFLASYFPSKIPSGANSYLRCWYLQVFCPSVCPFFLYHFLFPCNWHYLTIALRHKAFSIFTFSKNEILQCLASICTTMYQRHSFWCILSFTYILTF